MKALYRKVSEGQILEKQVPDKKRFFDKFSSFELIIIVVMAALGVAVKPIIVPIAHIVCGPLMIPSGAMAGGLYMMWMVIGYGMVRKRGTAFLIALVQTLLVVFTGIVGSHGIMTFLTYLGPGLAVELIMCMVPKFGPNRGVCLGAGTAANLIGTLTVNFVFFRTPGVYLILVLAIASLSGMIGGLISWQLIKIFDAFHVFSKGTKGVAAWVEE